MRWASFGVVVLLFFAGCEEPAGRSRFAQDMPPPRINPTANLDIPGVGELRTELAEKDTQIVDLKHQVEILREELARAKGKSAGMVEWVDLDLKSTMVNLGASDAVALDNQFAVYGSDADLENVKFRRGIVKITKIIGPHLSEAVVVEFSKSLPVRAGDRIYELSATGIGPLEKEASNTPEENTKVGEALKRLEAAFETPPLKRPATP